MNYLSVSEICSSAREDAFTSAREKLLVGELDQAQIELRTALKADVNAGQLWELLGQVSYTKGDYQEALDALEYAGLLIPLSPCGQLILAWCYEKNELVETAREIYQFLATLKNLENNLLEPLAKGLGRTGNFEAALRVCRVAARRTPESPEPLMGMVYYMRELNRPIEQILPCLFQAHHLDPEDVECRKMLAWLLHANGRSYDAAQLLSVISIEGHQCGNCLTGMQHVFAAVEDYENAKRCADALRSMALPVQ